MDKIEFYKNDSGDWRWRIICKENGKIIGASSEGYRNYAECRDNLSRVSAVQFNSFSSVEIIEP